MRESAPRMTPWSKLMAILREGLERGLDGGQGRGVGVHGGSEAGSNDGLVGGLIDEGRENGRRRTDLTSPFFKWSMSICIPSARLTVSYWGGAEVASFWVVLANLPSAFPSPVCPYWRVIYRGEDGFSNQ